MDKTKSVECIHFADKNGKDGTNYGRQIENAQINSGLLVSKFNFNFPQ